MKLCDSGMSKHLKDGSASRLSVRIPKCMAPQLYNGCMGMGVDS